MATCHLISKCWILTWISVLMLSSLIISGEPTKPTEPVKPTAEPTGEPGLQSSSQSIQSSSININSQHTSFGGSSGYIIQTSSQTVLSSEPLVPSSSYSGISMGILDKSTVQSRILFSSSSASQSRNVGISKTSTFYGSSEVSQSQSIKESLVTVMMTSTVSPTKSSTSLGVSYSVSESKMHSTSNLQSSNVGISSSISQSTSSLSGSSFNVVLPTLSSTTTTTASSTSLLRKSSSYTVKMPSSVISNSTSSIGNVITSSVLSGIASSTTLKESISASTDMVLSSMTSDNVTSMAITKSISNTLTRSASSGLYVPSTTIVSNATSSLYAPKTSTPMVVSAVSSDIIPSMTEKSSMATSSDISISKEVNISRSSPLISSQIAVTPSPSMLQTTTPFSSTVPTTHTPYLTTSRSLSLTSGSSMISTASFETSVVTSYVSSVHSVASTFKISPSSSFLQMSTSVIPTSPPPKGPSSPPLDVSVSKTSTNYIIVTWKPPPEDTLHGNQLHRYEVNVQKISSCQINVTHSPINTPISSSTVSHSYGSQASLKPSSSVKTVLALSSSVVLIPTEPPNPPLNLVGSVVNAGLNLSKTIDHLEVFTCYGIRVRAVTSLPGSWSSFLPGPWSSFVLARTKQAEPTAPPQNVKASTTSSRSILVQWLPPPQEHIHGVIKHYIVEYFKATDRNNIKNITTAGNSTSLNLTSLLPYTNYSVRVRAVNNVGPGPVSKEVANTTWEDAPSPPTDFSIQSVNSTSLFTRWRHPKRLNGATVKYKLYYRLTSHNTSKDALAYDGSGTEFLLTGLQKLSNYTITLFAYNVKLGFQSEDVFAFEFTHPAVATEPLGLQAWNISSTSVFVTWQPPKHVNGILKTYQVFYRPNGSSSNPANIQTNLSTNATLYAMHAYTLYIIYVCAETDQGCGPTATVYVMTDEGVPTEVRSFNQYNKTSTTAVTLTWTAPEYPNGHIGYELLYGPKASSMSMKTLSSSETNITISELLPYTSYTFIIKAFNLKSHQSGPSRNVSIRTQPSEPSAPRNIRLVHRTTVSLNITWDSPDLLNGRFWYYTVKIYEVGSNRFFPSKRVFKNSFKIASLEPYKEYKVMVSCTTNGGTGPNSQGTFRTLPSVPPTVIPIKPPNRDTITENQIVIELEKASDSNGKISFYQVIVLELASNSDGKAIMPDSKPDDYTPNQLSTYKQAKLEKPKLVPYVAAQFPAEEFSKYQLFKIGDGRNFSVRARKRRSTKEQYYNGPLEPSTFYTMFQRAAVNKDVYRSTGWTQPVSTSDAAVKETKKHKSGTNIGLVAGLCVTLVCLIVVAIVVIRLIWKKRRFPFGIMLDDEGDYSNRSFKLKKIHGSRRRTSSRGLMGSTDSLDNLDDINRRRQPIPVDVFTNHVRQMHIDGDIGFSEEYELVQPDDKDFTWQHSLMPVNKHKNRYANIVAYDHSRVLLAPIEGVQGSDYINANYIDGYNRSGAYIATQGPLPETFDDFWRMVWEQGTATIVMLTQLEERGRRKCDQYWPDRGTQTYGMIRVTASESSHMSYYNLRVFIISHKDEEEEPRQVKQYHFTSWPDHGVPTHPVPLLSLVRTVANANPSTAGPAIIHCSAGVGRTGTYITLDSVLQRIEKEQTIDVYEFVQNMRSKRNLMVQTESQYVFIHDALVEAVSCGITEFEAKKFASRLRELREIDPKSGRTLMEKEFLRLVKDERHHSTFKAANMGVNSSKNRYLNILPYEQTRVSLKMRPGEVGSDYINASFIDGYCRRKVYIATQAPLPCTLEDYWRMIWEQGSCVIVMLTKEEEAGKVKCHRYWPSDGTRIFGDVLVELTEEVSYPDYTMRQFNMTHTEEKDSRVVRQYHYTDWPDVGLPESGVGIIDLITQVEKWQQQSNNSIITVHCSGGVGRTGVYCAISILIERVKSEGVIDVFQSVQSLRLQRPAMVQTLEQYEFCYSTLQEYLDSFDLYANFN